jgi:hypothetical protein
MQRKSILEFNTRQVVDDVWDLDTFATFLTPMILVNKMPGLYSCGKTFVFTRMGVGASFTVCFALRFG